MADPCFFPFTVPKEILLPKQLNDPFGAEIPEVAKLAAKEVQAYLEQHQADWLHDFEGSRGKMFGVLVVEDKSGKMGYLSTFSGKMRDLPHPKVFVPSLFDLSVNDNFLTVGMLKIGEMKRQIESETSSAKIAELSKARKKFSIALQKELFDQYVFLNAQGTSKSLYDIFADFNGKKPPSGAGECAAPKLLQYAFEQQMKPLAIAEFWWGKSPPSEAKQHLAYYPACKDKCRPILSYMLGD
ncbi:MAG: pseudouridylate synthase [Bacteroidota bacterium]